MRVPTSFAAVFRPGRRAPAIGIVAFAAVVAACGNAPVTTTPPASAAAAPSVAVAILGGTASPATVPPAASASPAAATAAAPAPSLGTLSLLWQKAGPVSALTTTVASAVDPKTGNLWVAVPFENRYWIFKPDGTYLESWGKAGTGPGQLHLTDHSQNPNGWGSIAFTPDGSFYVGDTGNNRVEEFDPSGTFVRQWGTFGTGNGQFLQIICLATDGKTVYVGDGDRYDIQAFDGRGTFLREFGADAQAGLVAVDGHGVARAVGATTLLTYAPDGTVASKIDLGFMGGGGVALTSDRAGNTYVTAEIGQMPYSALGTWEIDPAGHVLRGWKEGADWVTVSPAGDVLYMSRGVQLDGTGWQYVRAYAVPKP